MSLGDQAIPAGAVMMGSGFTGILLSCAVIALADIRKAVTALVEGQTQAAINQTAGGLNDRQD